LTKTSRARRRRRHPSRSMFAACPHRHRHHLFAVHRIVYCNQRVYRFRNNLHASTTPRAHPPPRRREGAKTKAKAKVPSHDTRRHATTNERTNERKNEQTNKRRAHARTHAHVVVIVARDERTAGQRHGHDDAVRDGEREPILMVRVPFVRARMGAWRP